MDEDYKRYRFSATFHTDDLAVLHCLRSLCVGAAWRKEPKHRLGWLRRKEWVKKREAAIRFSSEARREQWRAKAQELFGGRWELVCTSNDDPARRQRLP